MVRVVHIPVSVKLMFILQYALCNVSLLVCMVSYVDKQENHVCITRFQLRKHAVVSS